MSSSLQLHYQHPPKIRGLYFSRAGKTSGHPIQQYLFLIVLSFPLPRQIHCLSPCSENLCIPLGFYEEKHPFLLIIVDPKDSTCWAESLTFLSPFPQKGLVSMRAVAELKVYGKHQTVCNINTVSLEGACRSLPTPDPGSPCFCTWSSLQHLPIVQNPLRETYFHGCIYSKINPL